MSGNEEAIQTILHLLDEQGTIPNTSVLTRHESSVLAGVVRSLASHEVRPRD
jgi:hypothetical protein